MRGRTAHDEAFHKANDAFHLDYQHRPLYPRVRSVEKRMCRNCGRDGTSRSMWFQPGGVYGM